MQRLSARNTVLVGLTLFSMFFGAGNLIFPPYLGAMAGQKLLPALLGFAVSAIGLPVLGVAVAARAGGLPALAGRVSARFAAVFTLLIYLSIGPCVAIPRTASTSFEMAVVPFLGGSSPAMRVGYAMMFFAVAMAVALRPDRISGFLGRITGPLLLGLILILVAGCLVQFPAVLDPARGAYQSNTAVEGFLYGYQTMDTIAALNFGIVIALNIRHRGVQEESGVVKATVRAGWITGVILLLVYSGLAVAGGLAGAGAETPANGAVLLSGMAGRLFGKWGTVLVGVIFVIACLNTCIGLLSCCGEYFHSICPRLSVRRWIAVFAAAGLCISVAGLDMILAFSTPVLNIIYPVAIVLIALGLAHSLLQRIPGIYPVCITVAAVFAVLCEVRRLGVAVPLVEHLPLYSQQLGWVVPVVGAAAAAAVAALFLPRTKA